MCLRPWMVKVQVHGPIREGVDLRSTVQGSPMRLSAGARVFGGGVLACARDKEFDNAATTAMIRCFLQLTLVNCRVGDATRGHPFSIDLK